MNLSSVNRLDTERYECLSCAKEYSDCEISQIWKCPDCDELIHVYAEDSQSGERAVLNRKCASDVEQFDLVHFPGQILGPSYRVLGTRIKGKKIALLLEGYGSYVLMPNDPVNIRIGGAW